MPLASQFDYNWISPIIAGVIALLGVAVGHLLTMIAAWLERKRRRNELLLSKLDELTVEIQLLVRWMNDINQSDTIYKMQELHPSHACYRAEALAHLYFQHLIPEVSQYMEALRNYYTWALQRVPEFSSDTTLPRPFLVCLHSLDKSSTTAYLADIDKRHGEFAKAVASEAKRLLR